MNHFYLVAAVILTLSVVFGFEAVKRTRERLRYTRYVRDLARLYGGKIPTRMSPRIY